MEELDVYCLSNAIEQALEDLAACEKSPNFKIDMSDWFKPIEFNGMTATKCCVCFAGSVMANRVGASVGSTPDDFSRMENLTYTALDHAQRYNFHGMLAVFFDVDEPDQEVLDALNQLELDMLRYYMNKRTFKSNMRKVVEKLREFEM